MQASLPESALRPGTFDLVAALDAYDMASRQLVARWLDMELYADFSRRIDAIREHGVCEPALTVLSLQLVIAHAELLCTMWQRASAGVGPDVLQQVQARHAHAIRELRDAAASARKA